MTENRSNIADRRWQLGRIRIVLACPEVRLCIHIAVEACRIILNQNRT